MKVLFGPIFGLLVAILLVLGLELTAWSVEALIRPSSEASDVVMEMPRWLVEARSKPERLSAQDLAWFSYFESGDGFRVRLRPDSNILFPDTFSWTKDLPDSAFRLRSNSEGFRGEWTLPSATDRSERQIAIFGDSSSFGWGVAEGEYYADHLSTLFADRLVVNFAMPGDSTEFGKLIFDKYRDQIEPDVVIISFGANDARPSSVPHSTLTEQFRATSDLLALRSTLSKNSSFFRLLERVLDSQTPRQEAIVSEKKSKQGRAVSLKEYRRNLVDFSRKAQEREGTKVILLALCSPGQYRRAMQKAAARSGAEFIDGVALLEAWIPRLQGDSVYSAQVAALKARVGDIRLRQQPLLYISTDGCHPNAIGHKIIAERLRQVIGDSLSNLGPPE
jgi:lysophospholipase L1-like esterase